jgi:DHA3 family macrolide efflux protein-like MFS transporter
LEIQADHVSFRNYLLFFAGQQISLLGSSASQFVVIWWITLETQSSWYLALASVAGFAPMILLTPFAGVIVDRWSRKLIIGLVDLLQALSTIVLISLFWLEIASVWFILILLVFRSCCQAFHVPAVEAIVPLMVPRDKLGRINGLNYVLNGIMTLIGPVTAAILLTFWKIHQILWIDPATFIVAVVLLLLIRIPSVRTEREKSSFKRDFAEGLAFIRNSRGLVPLIFLATALNFLLMPLTTLLPYFVNYDHHGLAAEFALVTAVTQLGMFGGGVFMIVMKELKRKILMTVVFILICFLGYALTAFTPTGWFWFMSMCLFIMTFTVAPANILLRTIIQTIVPGQMQGRVNSVLMSLSSAASPFGMVISGIIAAYTATANLFLACAIAGTLVLLSAWFFTDMRHVEEIKEASTTPADKASTPPVQD